MSAEADPGPGCMRLQSDVIKQYANIVIIVVILVDMNSHAAAGTGDLDWDV